jgi:hypothetical protein
MHSYRLVFEHFCKYQAYKCALWAFGDGFEELTPDALQTRWNNLHGDIFKLDSAGVIDEDCEKICKAWEKLRGQGNH